MNGWIHGSTKNGRDAYLHGNNNRRTSTIVRVGSEIRDKNVQKNKDSNSWKDMFEKMNIALVIMIPTSTIINYSTTYIY